MNRTILFGACAISLSTFAFAQVVNESKVTPHAGIEVDTAVQGVKPPPGRREHDDGKLPVLPNSELENRSRRTLREDDSFQGLAPHGAGTDAPYQELAALRKQVVQLQNQVEIKDKLIAALEAELAKYKK